MANKEEIQITIREARKEDAVELAQIAAQIGSETDFLIMDQTGTGLKRRQLEKELERMQASENNVLLVAFADERMIGIANIRGENDDRVVHVGEVGICILKEYWGIGLGSYLMEELIYWAQAVGIFQRLELRVQCRNERAVALYEKFHFVKEGRLRSNVRLDDGTFEDTYMMSLLLT